MAGIVVMMMLADTLLTKRNKKKSYLMIIKSTVLVCLYFISWQFFLRSTVISESAVKDDARKFSAVAASGITFDRILDFFKGVGPEYQYEVAKNYIKILFSEETFSLGTLRFPYIDLLIFFFLILCFFVKWRNEEKSKNRIYSFGICMLVGGIVYSMFLLLTYLFSFSKHEALLASSHSRYLGSWICGMAIVVFGLFCEQYREETTYLQSQKRGDFIIALLGALLVIITPVENLYIKNMDTETPEELVYGYEDIAEITRSFADKSERIYFLCNGSNGYSSLLFRNYVLPMKIYWGNLYVSKEAFREQMQHNAENGKEFDSTGRICTIDEWSSDLERCEYLFIFHPNEVFAESYNILFEEPETVDDGTFYKVMKTDSGIKLSYIGKVGVKEYK